jgi:tetratricopeptide (TPR) repeat protein
VPIQHSQRPLEPTPAALDANRRGVRLYSQGRSDEAAAAFREGITVQPELALLHVNLALVLTERGELEEARRAYERAIDLEPRNIAAANGLGSLHVRAGRFAEARSCFESVLALDPGDMSAHLSMYELEQIDGNVGAALAHQREVLKRKTMFSTIAPHERRRLLALMVPGDWQANVPVDFLVDRATTTLHKWYLVSPQAVAAPAIPAADAVFVAVGESDENQPALEALPELLHRIGLPYINDPRRILLTNRERLANALSGIPNLHAPKTVRATRDDLAAGRIDMPLPLLVRPVGSHAGKNLARVADAAALAAYLNDVPAQAFYVMPFVDFKSSDGFYRKYRIIVVDGVPYPYHLAISPNWMIHYYNAPMRETPWMREEEERFLNAFESVFAPPLQSALRDVARVLGLEYFGIDCAIDPQGRLLLFEADPAMIVHAGDEPELFAYKVPHAERIFAAFQQLIDRVRSR